MANLRACPTAGDLANFAAGLADEDRIQRIGGHLDSCVSCQAKLSGSAPLESLLRRDVLSGWSTELEHRLDDWARSTAKRAADSPRTFERPRLRPADAGTADLGRIGPYRVLRELGEGSMGVVYEARDTRLDRLVALKVLKPSWAADRDSRERFLREARAAAQIADERIISVFDVGEDDGTPYFAMALVQGTSLERRLRDRPRPAIDEVVDVARQIALGLSVAHGHGLVHRDIKPANIWVETVPLSAPAPHGLRVKLLDFGLARKMGEDIRLTQSGMVIGTPAYMSPEQAAGREADARSDLFGLGCILYRMTTGAVPFSGKDILAVVHALANKNPTPPWRVNPATPEWLSAIVMTLLVKDPANRFASALDVVAALDAGPRKTFRTARIVVGLVGCALLTGVVYFIAANRGGRPSDKHDRKIPEPLVKNAAKNIAKEKEPAPPTSQETDPVRALAIQVLNRGGSLKVGNPKVGGRDVAGIEQLPVGDFTIENISLTGDKVLGDALFDGLNLAHGSTNLDVGSAALTDAGLAKLTAVPGVGRLDSLGLTRCPLITDVGVAHLAKLDRLAQISLTELPVSGTGFSAMKENVTNMTLLSHHLSPEGVATIARMPGLRRLNLDSTQITPRHVDALADSKLEELILAGTGLTDEGVRSLSRIAGLKSLGIWQNRVTAKGLEEIKKLKNLVYLNVSDNPSLKEADVRALSEAMPNLKIQSEYGVIGPTK